MEFNEPSMDQNDIASYASMLYDARRHIEFVPDFETKPSILTNASISKTYESTYFEKTIKSPGAKGLYSAILIRPNDKMHSTYTGVIVEFNDFDVNAMNVVGPKFTTTKPMFVAKEYIPMSRKLAQSYTLMRPISSNTQIASATTSTTSAAISGVFHAAAFNDMEDFSTYQPAELNDASVTVKDSATQIPCYEGIVYTPGPEILQKFSVPPAQSSIEANSANMPENAVVSYTSSENVIEYQNYSNDAAVDASFGTAIVNNTNAPSTFIGSTIRVRGTLSFGSASLAGVGMTMAMYGVRVNAANEIVSRRYQIVAANSPDPGMNTTPSTFDVTFDLTDYNTNEAYTLVPQLFFEAGDQISVNDFLRYNVTISNVSQGGYSNLGPGCLILTEGLALGQTVQLEQFVNYEAVPNGRLTKDVKTSSYNWRKRDANEITAAEVAFNSPSYFVRRVYRGSDYFNSLAQNPQGLGKGEIMRNASFLGSLFRTVGQLAPTIGSLFGPTGAMIGNAVGGIAGSLAPRESAPLMRGRMSAPLMRSALSRRRAAKPIAYCTPIRMAATGHQPGSTQARVVGAKEHRPKEEHISRVEVMNRIKNNNRFQPSELFIGAATGLRPEGAALFPTVTSGVADVEALFVTSYPVKSLGVYNIDQFEAGEEDADMREMDTSYRKVTTTFSGVPSATRPEPPEIVMVNYFSDDFQGQELIDAAEIVSYMGLNKQYITAYTNGIISGTSYQLALVAACMRIPPVAAFSGSVKLAPYPNMLQVGGVGDIVAKVQACQENGKKLITAPESFTELGTTPWLDSDKVVTPMDIMVHNVPNLSWGVCVLSGVTDLAWPIMNILSTVEKGEEKNGTLSYKAPLTGSASKNSTKITPEEIKTLLLDSMPFKAATFVNSVDKTSALPRKVRETLSGMIEDYFVDKIRGFSMLVDGVSYDLKKAYEDESVKAEQYNKQVNSQLSYSLLEDPDKGLATIGYITKNIRDRIKESIKQYKTPAESTALPSLFGGKKEKRARPDTFDIATDIAPVKKRVVVEEPDTEEEATGIEDEFSDASEVPPPPAETLSRKKQNIKKRKLDDKNRPKRLDKRAPIDANALRRQQNIDSVRALFS